MKILIGCEESQAVCRAFRKLGHEAYSCDLQECSGGRPEWHLQIDVFEAIKLKKWDMGIFFPDCTYLTCCAEWCYNDIQTKKIKPGTLTGEARREARDIAESFFMKFTELDFPWCIENPVGIMSTRYRKPNQNIQPYNFGEDASKRTCLWLNGLPELKPTGYIEPRIVDGKPRWDNQTDSGQNKLPPSEDRAKLRSKTYQGIADAMADQWSNHLAPIDVESADYERNATGGHHCG